jgi:putative two-component system response regulator
MRILLIENNPVTVEQVCDEARRRAPELELEVAHNAVEAETRLAAQPGYKGVLLDLQLPGGEAVTLLERMQPPGLPVVLLCGAGEDEIGAAAQAISLGAVDFVAKSPGYLYRLPGVLARACRLAELETGQIQLREAHAAAQAQLERLQESLETMITSWALALELRDQEGKGQSLRVTELAVAVARAMGLSGETLTSVRRGALLHDVGRLGVPEAILQKKGPLTPDEWDVMKQHPTYSYQMLYPVELLRSAIDIPYCHHERWDGTGYPHGLKGSEIPLMARIFAVADVWEALNADRPYRPAWEREQVIRFLREQAGVKFDPQVVEALLSIVDK